MRFKSTLPLRRKPPAPLIKSVGRVLDMAGAAAYLGQDERWIRRRIDRKLIPCRKFVGRYIFIKSELDQFFADLPGVGVDEAKRNLSVRNGGDN